MATDDDDEQPPIEIPHDVVNEQILIAAALGDEKTREELATRVSPDLFVDENHQAIWTALREIRRRGLEFDLASLHAEVAGEVELSYLHELSASYPDPPQNISTHVAALRWDHVRAEAVRGPLAELIKSLRDPKTPPERVRALGRAVPTALDVATDRRFMRDPTQAAREADVMIRRRREQGVYPFGVEALDRDRAGKHRMLPGVAPGKVTVITGVSGGGKSILCAHVALAQARTGRKVLYGAWEMGHEETLALLGVLSLRATAETDDDRGRWDRWRLMAGDYSEDEMTELRARMERLGETIRFFDLPPRAERDPKKGAPHRRALDVLHQRIADSGCEVAVLDMWERAFSGFRGEDEERHALIDTQTIGRETQVHLMLAFQQRLKDVEQRSDPRPTREGIKGSSAVVDIADTILGVHRPAQWTSNRRDDALEIIVLKQRYGAWPLAVECRWNPVAGEISAGRDVEYRRETGARAAKGDFSDLGRRG